MHRRRSCGEASPARFLQLIPLVQQARIPGLAAKRALVHAVSSLRIVQNVELRNAQISPGNGERADPVPPSCASSESRPHSGAYRSRDCRDSSAPRALAGFRLNGDLQARSSLQGARESSSAAKLPRHASQIPTHSCSSPSRRSRATKACTRASDVPMRSVRQQASQQGEGIFAQARTRPDRSPHRAESGRLLPARRRIGARSCLAARKQQALGHHAEIERVQRQCIGDQQPALRRCGPCGAATPPSKRARLQIVRIGQQASFHLLQRQAQFAALRADRRQRIVSRGSATRNSTPTCEKPRRPRSFCLGRGAQGPGYRTAPIIRIADCAA